jgi:ankyrin repeat protein
VGKKSPKVIRAALRKLPSGSNAYDYAYKAAMTRIEGQVADQEELAKQVLSWITCAKRPLTILELRHALAVEVGESKLDDSNLPDIDDLINVCAGLVTVDQESGIIRLVHYTTQEYFQRTQSSWFPNAETNTTTICVTYLSFHDFEHGFCQTDSEFETRLQSNQFYRYAAQNWGHHARKIPNLSEALLQAVLNFLKSEPKVEASSQGLLAIKGYLSHSNYAQQIPRCITGLNLTAYFGTKAIASLLLDQGVKVDSKDSYGRTPLSWAAEEGHEAVAKLLLEQGAEVDSKDNSGRTPLLWAAEGGYESLAKLLLEQGAEVDSKDNSDQTPQLWAAEGGYESLTKILLEQSEPVHWTDSSGLTLSSAGERGHEAVAKMLLEGADANFKTMDGYGLTPLSRAVDRGHEAIAKLLLEQGAEVDSKDKCGVTPLLRAAVGGHEAIAKLLLEQGAEVDSKNSYDRTPLSWAAQGGHETVAKLLLEQ